jgi:hypothetical protein
VLNKHPIKRLCWAICTSSSQSVDNAEFAAMPQKVTRIVTRFFERCPPFQGKTGKRHIGKICRFDVPAINVKFTDFKCPDSGQMKFISETCFVF